MIAGVVATIEQTDVSLQDIITEISNLPFVEPGTVNADALRIPITIEASGPGDLEETTRRINQCRGVILVDVVFVHFEDEPESASSICSGKPEHS